MNIAAAFCLAPILFFGLMALQGALQRLPPPLSGANTARGNVLGMSGGEELTLHPSQTGPDILAACFYGPRTASRLALACALLAALSACGAPDGNQPAASAAAFEMAQESRPEEIPAAAAQRPELAVSLLTESGAPAAAEPEPPVASELSQIEGNTVELIITAGAQTFSATLNNSPAAQAFITQLPLAVTMDDLNKNEKFYVFASGFPTDPYQPQDIGAGDLMLYGSDCLVLFYKSFSSSYSYTKLGSIDDVSGLADALGSGSVSVSFQLK